MRFSSMLAFSWSFFLVERSSVALFMAIFRDPAVFFWFRRFVFGFPKKFLGHSKFSSLFSVCLSSGFAETAKIGPKSWGNISRFLSVFDGIGVIFRRFAWRITRRPSHDAMSSGIILLNRVVLAKFNKVSGLPKLNLGKSGNISPTFMAVSADPDIYRLKASFLSSYMGSLLRSAKRLATVDSAT